MPRVAETRRDWRRRSGHSAMCRRCSRADRTHPIAHTAAAKAETPQPKNSPSRDTAFHGDAPRRRASLRWAARTSRLSLTARAASRQSRSWSSRAPPPASPCFASPPSPGETGRRLTPPPPRRLQPLVGPPGGGRHDCRPVPQVVQEIHGEPAPVAPVCSLDLSRHRLTAARHRRAGTYFAGHHSLSASLEGGWEHAGQGSPA